MTTAPVFELVCGAQSYDWGKLGKDGSKVSHFAQATAGFVYDEAKPYAEVQLALSNANVALSWLIFATDAALDGNAPFLPLSPPVEPGSVKGSSPEEYRTIGSEGSQQVWTRSSVPL